MRFMLIGRFKFENVKIIIKSVLDKGIIDSLFDLLFILSETKRLREIYKKYGIKLKFRVIK